jgi:hypothetical protein
VRGGHSGDWRAGMPHAVVRARRHDKHSRRWRRDGSEGTIPATAGVRACSYALVRTRGATAHSALGADSGRGSLWLRRGEGEGPFARVPKRDYRHLSG